MKTSNLLLKVQIIFYMIRYYLMELFVLFLQIGILCNCIFQLLIMFFYIYLIFTDLLFKIPYLFMMLLNNLLFCQNELFFRLRFCSECIYSRRCPICVCVYFFYKEIFDALSSCACV